MELKNLAPEHLEQVYNVVVADDTIPQSFCSGVVPSDDEFVARLWQNALTNLVMVGDDGTVLAYGRLSADTVRDQFSQVFVAVPATHRQKGLGTAMVGGCRAVAVRRHGIRVLVGYVPGPFLAAFRGLVDRGEWREAGVLRDELLLLGEWTDVHVLDGRLD